MRGRAKRETMECGRRASVPWAAMLVVMTAWGAVAPSLHAQERSAAYQKDTEAARALFGAGLAYADEEAWERAAERFRQSLQLRESAVVEYNLSAALAKLGKVAEASRRLQALAQNPEAEAEVRAAAGDLLGEVLPRVGSLKVALRGDLREARLRLDDRQLSAEALQKGVPVGPGEHVLVAERHGRPVASRRVRLTAGQAARTSLEVPPYVPGPEEAARMSYAGGDGQEHTSARDELVSSPWFWGAVGVATVATVITVVVLATSGDEADTAMANGGALAVPFAP